MAAQIVPVLTVLLSLGILVGWVLPLVVGILRRRSGHGGVGWFIFSGVWVLAAMGLIGMAFYGLRSVRVHKNVEKFDAANYSGPTGKIVLPFQGEVTLQLLDRPNGRVLQCAGKGGSVLAPAGNYRIHRFEAALTDEGGVRWIAHTYFSRSDADPFELKPNGTQAIEAGPPFVARVTAQTTGRDRAEFVLELSGRGNGRYVISRTDSAAAAPAFEVVSSGGEVLWRGNFKFG